MTFKRKCYWCENEFETDDVDLDHCSIECFHANESFDMEDGDD